MITSIYNWDCNSNKSVKLTSYYHVIQIENSYRLQISVVQIS